MNATNDILVKKKAWFIRFFMWSWDISEDKLDQCRVFWGLVFFPIGCLNNESILGWFVGCLGFLFYALIIQLVTGDPVIEAVLIILAVVHLLGLLVCIIAFCIMGFEDVIKLLKKKSNTSEKVLNKITVVGSTIKSGIYRFLATILRPFGKLILFLLRPLTKWIPWKKLIELIIDNDKARGFFKFIIMYVTDFKEQHCRKIKLV